MEYVEYMNPFKLKIIFYVSYLSPPFMMQEQHLLLTLKKRAVSDEVH